MELLKDRSHYRMCEDSLLLEEAKYNPTAELAIVLGERLEAAGVEYEEEIEELRERAALFEGDANQFEDELYNMQQKIDELELMLSTRDETIEELKKGN